MRKKLLQHINWKNNQEKQNRNTVLGGSAPALTLKNSLSEPCKKFLSVSMTYQTDKHKEREPKDQEFT